MSIITKFLEGIRKSRFAKYIEREIYFKIFPHLNGRADFGYPFSSNNELYKARLQGSSSLRKMLCDLDSAALDTMGEAECNAFLYAAHRDVEERLRMYLNYAQARQRERKPLELQSVAAAA